MAIYHMQAKVVSRGSGRSAVAASAYMSCSRMYNDYDGIQHDYTRKQGLIYQEVMLPPMAPLEWNDREQLWNAVEETEKTKDSRLAREFVVALPVELDKNSNISLLCLSQQAIHILHGAELRVNPAVIGDIVALVGAGREVDGGEPENLDSQFL